MAACWDSRRPRPDGDAELEALFVEPQAWRKGVGRALVDGCVAEAARGGAKVLHVIGNPNARSFYDTCGFVIYGIRDMPLGKGILMKKPIR
jgi:GNAT superfamily N-acetyltransferase